MLVTVLHVVVSLTVYKMRIMYGVTVAWGGRNPPTLATVCGERRGRPSVRARARLTDKRREEISPKHREIRGELGEVTSRPALGAGLL